MHRPPVLLGRHVHLHMQQGQAGQGSHAQIVMRPLQHLQIPATGHSQPQHRADQALCRVDECDWLRPLHESEFRQVKKAFLDNLPEDRIRELLERCNLPWPCPAPEPARPSSTQGQVHPTHLLSQGHLPRGSCQTLGQALERTLTN